MKYELKTNNNIAYMGSAYRNVKGVREATQAVMLIDSCGFPSGVRRRVLKSGKYSPRKILFSV
jgi:hypothetical protein